MTLTKQLTYEVRDLNGAIKPNQSISLALKINESRPKYLIHRILILQDANRRQGTASCKTRSEVRGGGRKPWKQKGTGQARSGSSNSPLWNGGGVTFGPKPRDYYKKINIKERQRHHAEEEGGGIKKLTCLRFARTVLAEARCNSAC